MSNSKFKLKKIICSSVLCFGFLASAFAGVHFNKPTDVSASSNSGYIVQDVTSSAFGTGYNFNVTTSDKPVTPTSWSALTEEVSNVDNIKKGVVDLGSDTSFDSEEWMLSTKPSMPDSDNESDVYYKNLMINSYSGAGKMGYESDKSISLEANSFYKISVLLYTHKTSATQDADETDPRASIYLTGLLDENEENYDKTKFEYFSTLNSWEEYSFYIDTNDSKTVKLQLWLGSKTASVQGAVFFNNVKVLRYSEDAYLDKVSNLQDNDNDNFNILSFGSDYTEPVNNSSFEDVSQSWTKKAQSTSSASDQLCQIVDVNSFTKVNDDLTITTPYSNGSANNQNALFMYNKVDGYQAVESSEFTINQHAYYRLSFWSKSDCNTGSGATVMLVDKSEENAIDSASLTLATTFSKDSNEFRNDWTQYNFYIYGASAKNTNATIQIWLGTQDSKTSGYVFVDDFRIEQIDYSTYSANSSGTNSTAFNLNGSNDKYTITNSDFNITQNNSVDTIYPATPASWTFSGNANSNSFSGVVNTSEDIFNANLDKFGQGYTYPTKPNKLPYATSDNNNVLMIGSTSETNNQTYTSGSLTLSANSYYNLSFYVMTDYIKNNTTTNYGANVAMSSDTKTIFALYNIKFDDNEWHQINVKIKTGDVDESAKVALTFEKLIGYVFFDKVELRTIDEATYNDTTFDNSNIAPYKVDLSYENFSNNTYGKNLTSNGVDSPSAWTFSANDSITGVTAGSITSSSAVASDIPSSLSGNKTYLYISALHDEHLSYTSKQTYTFNSETYYKISVNVLTRYINIDEEYDEEFTPGASLKLTTSNELLLKGINTASDDSNGVGVWKTYTIFASFTDSISSTITLSLGYTDEKCMGEVFFDNLQITTLDADAYATAIEDAELGTYATFTNYTAPVEEEDEEVTPWENTFNWLILPSLITALSIIIAVVGFYIRKLKINIKPKVKTNYDRRKTLDKDIDRREKIALRKQIIEELRAELQAIDKEIDDFNVVAEQKLDEIKAQIKLEQDELKKEKLDIEIRKKEATAEREKQLKETPEFVSNTKAEKEYNNFIAKLDKQEMTIQKKINDKEFKLSLAREANKEKLEKYAARQEYIKLQIAKIEAEIEEIARQEEEMWAEYKAAKEDAKRRKAEYKAQVKAEKEKQARNKRIAEIANARESANTNKTSTSTNPKSKYSTKSTNSKSSTPKTTTNKSNTEDKQDN